MTDKERLEDINNFSSLPLKKRISLTKESIKKELKANDYHMPKNININTQYLLEIIEQSERVEELEKDLLELVKQNKELRKSIAFYSSESYNAHLERLLDRSEKQIKRYREALEEIANSDGWLIEPNPLCTIEEAYERCVDTACRALEGEK